MSDYTPKPIRWHTSDAADWERNNCERCTKGCYEVFDGRWVWPCKLQHLLTLAWGLQLDVCEFIARRSGFDNATGPLWDCLEREEVTDA